MTKTAIPNTLCIDVGGSHVKAALVAPDGRMLGEPVRVSTPAGDGPAALLEVIAELVAPLLAASDTASRVAVGFPGALRDGVVLTAPNLGGSEWHRVPLADQLARRIGRPVRMANDATVQGLGAIAGRGLECAITLGTGMGFALFRDGAPSAQIELGQHVAHKRKSYDDYVGDRALDKVGSKHWNRRVERVIVWLRELVQFDLLYIGGGNARCINFGLPADVHLVSNETGILGGVRLWDVFPTPAGREGA
jgi:polyphosphate glucokinase